MNYKNANVFGADFRFHMTSFGVENGVFAHVGENHGDALDLEGQFVLPGLVDIHTHGNSGVLFSDGKESSIKTIAAYLAKNGVTSFNATSMSDTESELTEAFQTAARMSYGMPSGYAAIRGVNMEGPFLSPKKKGAMTEGNLIAPDIAMFERLDKAAGGLIKIVSVAPELEGAMEFIREASKVAKVSLAHSTADYDTAMDGFKAGATHVTHLFNAMPAFLHRAPGIVGAAADTENVSVELISDGIHIHPAVVRAAFKIFGPERVILISDATQYCGMPEGQYGEILVNRGKVNLPDGTLFGSAANLFECLTRAVSFGIPIEDAVRCVTFNPARAIGAADMIGVIEPGKHADFLICSPELCLRHVMIDGREVA